MTEINEVAEMLDSIEYPQIHYTAYNKKKALWKKYESGLIMECCYGYNRSPIFTDKSIRQKIKCKLGKHESLMNYFFKAFYHDDLNSICVHCGTHYKEWWY